MEKLVSSRIEKETAYKVIIKNYAYLVEHVDALRVFPQLVESRLVEQDFRQRLERKETDKEKMMALIQALTRCTEETWFDGFTNALSKVPHYENVAGTLLKDFKMTLEERMTNPTEEAASKDAPDLLHDDGALVVNVTVSGVDEVMKKAMEDAQVAMKEAKRDHSKALSELTKANDRVLEAEKGKVRAEAEKRVLEMAVQEVGGKLGDAEDKLREAEVHRQLLEKEFILTLEMERENATSAKQALEGELSEAKRTQEKMDEIVRQLKEELEKNNAEHTKVQERQKEVVRELKEELEKNLAEQERQEGVVRVLKGELELMQHLHAEPPKQVDPTSLPPVSLEILVEFIPQMAPYWYLLAVSLGVARQAAIIEDNTGRTDKKCTEALVAWIDSCQSVTWSRLLQALHMQGLEDVASGLESKLNALQQTAQCLSNGCSANGGSALYQS